MEENEAIDVSKRKFTSRLIVERAIARDWKIVGFKTNPAIFLLYVPGRKEPVKLFSASPPQMSYPAAKFAKDKFITNRLLAIQELPVPEEVLVDTSQQINEAELEAFLSKSTLVVVKPLDASHGKGITMNVATIDDLKKAIKEARNQSDKDTIVVQEQIEGFDIRVVCIDYKAVDAISRIPASVIGDGEHTVHELIEIANQSDERGENYKAKLNVIPLDKARQHLGKEKINTVPRKNETIQVIGVSNIGMGGVRSNLFSDVPQFLKEIAERAAKTMELPVCGVDFMVKKLPKSDDTFKDLYPAIIEVNECPMLTMYDDLYSDEQNRVIDHYLDFVAEYRS